MKNIGSNELTISKHAALFANYLKIIKRHGDIAKYISKYKLYEEACKPFFISPAVAGRIIRKLMENPPNEILMDEEYSEMLKSGLV